MQHPLVWYNNAENLGVRFFTIPVKDLFYGFELVLGNVILFELIKIKVMWSKMVGGFLEFNS